MKYFASYFYNEACILYNWLEIPSPIYTHVPPKKTLPLPFLDTPGQTSPYQKQEPVESELSLSLSSPCITASMVKGSFVGSFQTLWKSWTGMT